MSETNDRDDTAQRAEDVLSAAQEQFPDLYNPDGTFNSDALSGDAAEVYQLGAMHGELSTRMARDRLAHFGESFDGRRNIYDALGWEEDLTWANYWNAYLRNPLARAVVDAPAKTSWRHGPTITDDANSEDETAFEKAVTDLIREHRLLQKWRDADRLTGIGKYGLLVIGAADGRELKEPLGQASEVAYFQPVSEDSVTDIKYARNEDDERPVGMPVQYSIRFPKGAQGYGSGDTFSDVAKVHFSRVVHIAENTLESHLFGRPRMEAVYNAVHDVEKVVGAVAEMAWRGADYGLLLQAMEGYELGDKDELTEEALAYYHGLQPFLRMEGMNVETLGGDVSDPSGIIENLLKLVAGETGIPKRILTGSERGELASTQDRASWLGRMSERQMDFNTPVIVRPTLEPLIAAGILPDPTGGDFEVEWPNLFELNEIEKAEVMERKAKALKDAAQAMAMTGAFTPEEIRQEVFEWEPVVGTQADLPEGTPESDVTTEPGDIPDGSPVEDVDEEDPQVVEQFRETQRAIADGGSE